MTLEENNEKRFTLRLERHQSEKLNEEAKRKYISVNTLIKQMVDERYSPEESGKTA